jgi:uncharacterized membrane-anchored protein
MSSPLGRRFLRLFAAFALFALTGDLIADSLADVQGDHCVSESSQSDSNHEKTPCSHCSCAVHNGAAVAFSDAVNVGDGSGASLCIVNGDESASVGARAAIDHPPQLG